MQSKVMSRKPSGRATPSKAALRKAMSNEKWDVSESRSVRTGWIWRGFLVLSMFAVGIAITMQAYHHGSLAVLWLVIAAGWFAVSMWLWRKHSQYMRGD